ncbi:superoxide dismutase[Cu-Zn] [Komagataeibacter sp. FNDCF1]|uniref:superoxide dismutase[Cu-Zn] n=1 Tax=Komagataeibacter sp. FNDCF1 TaxID=2878681 RepID=UPI001E50755F|nr:superoxide dismutase family protein [Komagataeibacter sp. FNDCF1]MCE2563580.1 superoxide dismutase family protein [Komagataeibacter sp. FNDCF1]
MPVSSFRVSAALVAGLAALPVMAHAADTASAHLVGTDGTDRGTASITEAPKGVILRVEAKGLTPGWHGIHFHEKGDCGPPKFTSAGSHVHAATPVVHGLLNPNANDAGDLPNLFVSQDGTGTAEFYSTLVSLNGKDGRPALLDADGASLVIHANPDDYKTQPIGGAGDRLICGVIR